jgi:hypothetical protein
MRRGYTVCPLCCASESIFPPEIFERVDHAVTFQELVADSASYIGRTIQLGRQIVQSEEEQHKVSLLVLELPIRTEPLYGPAETGKFRGMLIIG